MPGSFGKKQEVVHTFVITTPVRQQDAQDVSCHMVNQFCCIIGNYNENSRQLNFLKGNPPK